MPEIGKVYNLGNENYRYGTGALTCRITRIIRKASFDGQPWWECEAVCKPTGYTGPGNERHIYVRASALRA